ncbi:MAG: hypothetical protein ACKVRO_08455 [Micropepsaceae bacterium]
MMLSAVLAAALSAASVSPCDVATTDEAERVLGGAAVDVPASEMGEETAPYCLWATAERAAEIKLTVWGPDELPVLDMPDAGAYFLKLHSEATASGRVMPLGGLGERAFAADLYPKANGKADGAIVVLKAGRVFVFDFKDVVSRDAQAFAKSVMARV